MVLNIYKRLPMLNAPEEFCLLVSFQWRKDGLIKDDRSCCSPVTIGASY